MACAHILRCTVHVICVWMYVCVCVCVCLSNILWVSSVLFSLTGFTSNRLVSSVLRCVRVVIYHYMAMGGSLSLSLRVSHENEFLPLSHLILAYLVSYITLNNLFRYCAQTPGYVQYMTRICIEGEHWFICFEFFWSVIRSRFVRMLVLTHDHI